jgi:3-oxoacyl-[acyl-carrier protein] reductase
MSYTINRVTQALGHLSPPRGLLENQVAIITGAGQGIGAETARAFASQAAQVVLADIDKGT